MIRALRFFLVLRLQPSYALVLTVLCTLFSAWMAWADPRELDSGLGIVMFVQMFLASSGFVPRARAGHLDPMLWAGGSRVRAAAAHWLVSALPGCIAWLTLSSVGLALGNPIALSAIAGRRAVGMVVVSALAWVLGYRLPRGAAGVAWMAVLVSILLQHQAQLFVRVFEPEASNALLRLGALLICPFVLVGNRPVVSPALLVSAALVCGALLAGAVLLTRRLDVLLLERT